MRTSQKTPETITTIEIDLGKNAFPRWVGQAGRNRSAAEGIPRSAWTLSNVPRCLIGMKACSRSHHIGRQLAGLGQDVRLIPAQDVRPFLKGHKNDYRDAEGPCSDQLCTLSRSRHRNRWTCSLCIACARALWDSGPA
jgi:transposase